jgi:hypothetical protein
LQGKISFYTYLPLAEDEIRLLSVQKRDGETVYELIHVQFDKAPRYTALSYCWEDQSPDQPLNCAGSTLLVTANVKNFLSYFCTQAEPQYIWIDGLCINQTDISEKNHQVGFMKSVYTKASKVVIWLGESNDSINDAIRQIPYVLPSAATYRGTKSGFDDALKSYGIPIRGSLFWEGIETLLSKPWFSRLWTFQEAVLPKNVEVRCGKDMLSYDLMTALTRALSNDSNPLSLFKGRRRSGSRVDTQPRGRQTWMRVAQCRDLIAKQPDSMLSFSMLLIYGRDLSATNPADKIYGMLGLAKPSMQSLISIDYARHYHDVYVHFMKIYFAEGGESRLLNMVDGHTEGLPTWCPDFAVNKRYMSVANYLGCTFHAGQRAGYQHSPASQWLQLDNIGGSLGRRKLAVRGFFLDSIRTTVSYPRGPNSIGPPKTIEEGVKLIDWEATCLAISQLAYGHPDSTPEAHVRTLTGGSAKKCADGNNDHELLMSYMLRYGSDKHRIGHRELHELSSKERDRGRYLLKTLIKFCSERCFFSTNFGRIGLAQARVKPEDRVCIFYGGLSPFIIRPTEEDPTQYELMGEAYVDGVMYGEAFKLDESKEAETIVLV